jgi:hypothetical protein
LHSGGLNVADEITVDRRTFDCPDNNPGIVPERRAVRNLPAAMTVAITKRKVYPNVAKAGAIQSQGAKGDAVVIYCNPLATPDLDCSGFPVRGTT